MPEYTIDETGQLVDGDGKTVQIGGESVTVANVKRQEDVDRAFQAEKAKHKGKLDDLTAKIRALEEQAGKSAEVSKVLETMKAEKAELETKLADAERQAADKVAGQLKRATEAAAQAKQELDAERAARVYDQVTNLVLAKAGDKFNEPGVDVVPNLLSVHKREPAQDAQGKPIEGQYVDLFEMTYENEKSERVTERLPVEKALEIWAAQHPHHVRASGASGSGGGRYTNTHNMKRSAMSTKEKSDFITAHGEEAYKALPA